MFEEVVVVKKSDRGGVIIRFASRVSVDLQAANLPLTRLRIQP